ncbi:MAG: DUF4349 domain-containing protein [Hyphomonadaceae bacterium]|nr:DUF4349 domain-containing protein [Hyphomonadaceae bacterium]
MRIGLAVLAALALAGCSQRDAAAPAPEMAAVGAATQAFADGEASPADAAAPPPEAGAPARTPGAGAALMAYVYGATLEFPTREVRAAMARHEAACRAAGPATCQVLGSTVNAVSDEQIYGTIQLRAEPRWLEGFRAGLEGDARGAGGRVRETSVASEDLTRQIVDIDARLRAQKTLRDRLQQLLRARPGRLADLLETERELARVQGEIDSAESQLAVMRERVATALLNLGYQSRPNAVTGGTFAPLAEAFTEFFSIVMLGFAFIVRLIAVLIPVGVVLAPLAWLFLRWRRARAAKKMATP